MTLRGSGAGAIADGGMGLCRSALRSVLSSLERVLDVWLVFFNSVAGGSVYILLFSSLREFGDDVRCLGVRREER